MKLERDLNNAGHNLEHFEKQDICFFFEETTEDYQITGGGESLINKIVVFRGISEDDIKTRNPRFLGYISTLGNMGELPDFQK